ncbi:Nuclear protein STH1/NPS1 [Leucoagaricus sp. SymC.cos]|nr:Nuclear protein STH1/NPS1 [Leucoagaricus sp. SymC.cos]
MPSHSVACALIKLYDLGGAPWEWQTWKDLTGIHHGLFPTKDEHLPKGLTREKADIIQSYFNAYLRIGSEEEKIKFASKSKGVPDHPGRKLWNSFVSKHWSRWGVHGIVVAELKEADCHPHDILIRENNPKLKWPIADIYLTKILDTLGWQLFGEEAFPDNCDVLRTDIRLCIKMIAQQSWTSIRGHVTNLKNRAAAIEAAARASFEALNEGKLTKAKLNRAVCDVAKWKECAEILGIPADVQTAKEMLTEIQEMMEEVKAKTTRYCKVSAQALKGLASKEGVTDILNVYHEYFESHTEEEDDVPIPEISTSDALNEDTGEFGMEVEASLMAEVIEQRLGVFTSELVPNHPPGVLIGDEVGLGKTAQSIATIAFINQLIYLQTEKKKLPPVIAERPFLNRSNMIPSLPHLIVCPGTLSAQWIIELKTLLLPQSVDIHTYDSHTKPEVFWGPSGPLRSSKHAFHHQVVVASHSVVFNEFKKSHRPIPKGKNARPWDIPNPRKSLENTIFGQKFLVVVIDEAHHIHNPGNKHTATLRLVQQAQIRLIMTATPLHTAPKDIAHLSRLVGIPYFSTEEAYDEERADTSRICKAKKEDKAEGNQDGEKARAEELQIVRRLQKPVHGHFLHRTTKTISSDGAPLLNLPPCTDIVGLLTLTEREMDIIRERAEAAAAAVATASDSWMHTKKFYLEYRLAVGYAKEDPADLWPSFKTLDEWIPRRSTKMDVCAKICAHYLTHDDVGHVSFLDGEPVFPSTDADSTNLLKTRRILIYAEFPSMAPLLQNVLRLYGVESYAINGGVSFEQRDKFVNAFKKEASTACVLILSSVGSAGLNLSIADIVIFFDQPWSAQDEHQVKGRAHRQPQKKEVKLIRLLAIDSSDLHLYGVAKRKRNMFDAFVNKELSEDLRGILEGRIPGEDCEDADEDSNSDAKPKPKPKPKTRRRTRRIVVDDDNDEPSASTNDPQASVPAPSLDLDNVSNTNHSSSLAPSPGLESYSETDIPACPPYRNPRSDTSSDCDDDMISLSENEGGVEPQQVEEDEDLRLDAMHIDESDNSIQQNQRGPHSPPHLHDDHRAKRQCQSTIGEEGRAQIMNAQPTTHLPCAANQQLPSAVTSNVLRETGEEEPPQQPSQPKRNPFARKTISAAPSSRITTDYPNSYYRIRDSFQPTARPISNPNLHAQLLAETPSDTPMAGVDLPVVMLQAYSSMSTPSPAVIPRSRNLIPSGNTRTAPPSRPVSQLTAALARARAANAAQAQGLVNQPTTSSMVVPSITPTSAVQEDTGSVPPKSALKGVWTTRKKQP